MNPTDLLWEAESETLLAIARHLRAGNLASADWKTDRLQKLGALTNETASILKRYRDGILSGTMSEIEKAAMDRLLRSEKIMAQAKARGASLFSPLPPEADPAMHGIIMAWQETAKNQMNLAMATMLEQTGQLYVDTINRTTLQVLTGAMSGREALVKTVKEWAASGIPSIVDRAGRQWTTEAYSNMVIRTNTTRVATEVQFKRAKEYGADLIEVSSHAGARPLCAPYQGKIFSISGKSEKYPPLSSTSYGEPAGLFGINCGHMQYPFFQGISRQTYAPTGDAEENAEQYQESQKQRAIERSIRAAKRELGTLEALGDQKAIAEAKSKIRERQAVMREFIAETGRTRQRAREAICD